MPSRRTHGPSDVKRDAADTVLDDSQALKLPLASPAATARARQIASPAARPVAPPASGDAPRSPVTATDVRNARFPTTAGNTGAGPGPVSKHSRCAEKPHSVLPHCVHSVPVT